MAFIKNGDSNPVLNCYDVDEKLVCLKCKKPKTVIALEDDENKIICECEVEPEQN